MKSIKQIEQDPRVYSVERVTDSDSKYFLWLVDGYVFCDGTTMAPASTVKELNELLAEIEVAKQ
jgi:hypothetical protein